MLLRPIGRDAQEEVKTRVLMVHRDQRGRKRGSLSIPCESDQHLQQAKRGSRCGGVQLQCGAIGLLGLKPAAAVAVVVPSSSLLGDRSAGWIICLRHRSLLAGSRHPATFAKSISPQLRTTAHGFVRRAGSRRPTLIAPSDFIAAEERGLLAWLPSYWFLALFQQLNGSMHLALTHSLHRAWTALAVIGSRTAAAHMLAYVRTLPSIVKELEITPGSNRGGRLPDFGSPFQTAIVQFSIRTLFRSRQHRLLLAFYLGLRFAISVRFLKSPAVREVLTAASIDSPFGGMSGALLASSIVMMSAWIVGMRMVLALPLDLPANWMLRITPLPGGHTCLAARRWTLVAWSLAPFWTSSVALFSWPRKPALFHLAVLGLVGVTIVELCLVGAKKIPFTCSWRPGRSNSHITFWLCVGLLVTLVAEGVRIEREAYDDPRLVSAMRLTLAIGSL